MNWTDCLLADVVPGGLSGAPAILHSCVRREDLVANRDEGPKWLAEK
jgi:hypothetical protein